MNVTWNSTSPATKPLSHDRLYYFLPYWDEKPTMYIRSSFPDHRRRMYLSNVIARVARKLVRVVFAHSEEWTRDLDHMIMLPLFCFSRDCYILHA